jgi:hypothetical protein
MRNFNDHDTKKKQVRIQTKEYPEGLSQEALSRLEFMVKSSLKDGYLPCALALTIARDADVPKVALGMMIDRLGIRITNCQIGCFKVDKSIHANSEPKKTDGKIMSALEALKAKDELTCTKVFELAYEVKMTPMAIADVANYQKLKIRLCQLGCF